jgi:hypothetical protein
MNRHVHFSWATFWTFEQGRLIHGQPKDRLGSPTIILRFALLVKSIYSGCTWGDSVKLRTSIRLRRRSHVTPMVSQNRSKSNPSPLPVWCRDQAWWSRDVMTSLRLSHNHQVRPDTVPKVGFGPNTTCRFNAGISSLRNSVKEAQFRSDVVDGYHGCCSEFYGAPKRS